MELNHPIPTQGCQGKPMHHNRPEIRISIRSIGTIQSFGQSLGKDVAQEYTHLSTSSPAHSINQAPSTNSSSHIVRPCSTIKVCLRNRPKVPVVVCTQAIPVFDGIENEIFVIIATPWLASQVVIGQEGLAGCQLRAPEH
jgi:hypothetical protein